MGRRKSMTAESGERSCELLVVSKQHEQAMLPLHVHSYMSVCRMPLLPSWHVRAVVQHARHLVCVL